MDVLTGRIPGSRVLERDTDVTGMVEGDLTVPGGIFLLLHGTVTGNLLVEPGGMARVRGMVTGSLINRGGDVIVYGAVRSLQDLEPSRPTRVADGAQVGP